MKKLRYIITSAEPATKKYKIPGGKQLYLKEKDMLKIASKLMDLVGDSDQQFAVPIATVVRSAKAHVRICLIDAGKEIDKCATLDELDRVSKKWLKELNRIRKLYM